MYSLVDREIIKKRNRKKLWMIIFQAVKELKKAPWKSLYPIIFFLSCLKINEIKERILLILFVGQPELIAKILQITLNFLFAVISILVFFLIIYVMGRPLNARKIEESLQLIDFVDKRGFPPILISNIKWGSNDTRKLIFYSKGISLYEWNQRR